MNPLQLINSFRQFMQNPASFLSNMGLPEDALQNPKAAVQQLMNNGQMTQQQFNQLSSMANQLQNNQQFMSAFK